MAKVFIPTTLQQFTLGQAVIELPGTTVQEILNGLGTVYPELNKYIFTTEGVLKNMMRIYVDEEDIRGLDHEATPVQHHQVVSIITAVAGG